MKILGVSFDYHDAAAALLCNGSLVAAAQEERFSRKKNDPSLPARAIDFCLTQAGIKAGELDMVVMYERPLLKFDRIVRHARTQGSRGEDYVAEAEREWIAQGKFDYKQRLVELLQIKPKLIRCIEHHQAHAASAYYASGFDRATIVTLDGVGEYETASISVGEGTQLIKRSSLELPHSLGLLYSAFTAYLGFEVNEGEYKVMGMAGFGAPALLDTIRPMVHLLPEGKFELNPKYFDFATPETVAYTQAFVDLLGPARKPETPFSVRQEDASTVDLASCVHYANIAASVQRLAEEVILHVVRGAIAQTGINNLCMAGGVALNSMANGRIERELGVPLYIQPAAGDAGGAVGAALYAHHQWLNGIRTPPIASAYLGRAYSTEECLQALDDAGVENKEVFASEAELVTHVAKLLADGKVIGWLNGRFEWGPRALGARSILADPRRAHMQALVNEKIKFREPFRPFAPSVLAHRAEEFFDLPTNRCPLCPEDFMLSVSPVRADKREQVPAITHVDGSARAQLVRKETNPRYFALIEAFAALTDTPLVLNTSFNRRGEPIVASPADALETFMWTGLDYLVLENVLVWK